MDDGGWYAIWACDHIWERCERWLNDMDVEDDEIRDIFESAYEHHHQNPVVVCDICRAVPVHVSVTLKDAAFDEEESDDERGWHLRHILSGIRDHVQPSPRAFSCMWCGVTLEVPAHFDERQEEAHFSEHGWTREWNLCWCPPCSEKRSQVPWLQRARQSC